ncbi:hypothetical protein [Streptomyces sp. NPDC056069]|uniref:Rv1733c family protein n=1 Tax=Streptomyces sp. NPDC056069 TaxID=3345702 RepID=UPI0035E25C79
MNSHQPSRPGPSSSPAGPARRTALVVVLAIAVVCGAVAAAVLWRAGAAADRELAAHRHQVTATTTGPAAQPAAGARYGAEPLFSAKAVWSYPKGVPRSGTVDVPARTPRGRAVTIWVDDAGAPARPPGGTADRAVTALAGGIATAGIATGAGAGVVLLRRRSRAGGSADLEREWQRVEPVWSGRLRRGGTGTGDG